MKTRLPLQRGFALSGSVVAIGLLAILVAIPLTVKLTQREQAKDSKAVGPRPSEWANPNRRADIDTPIKRKVLSVIFDPVLENKGGIRLSHYMSWNDPKRMEREYIDLLNTISAGVVEYEIVSRVDGVDYFPAKTDGYSYTDEDYINVIENGRNPHVPGWADYNKIIDDLNLCNRRNNDEFHEVWLWGGPHFGFWESAMAGANAFNINGGPIANTNCDERLYIMGYSYERSLKEMVHNMGHRVETTMEHYYKEQTGPTNPTTPWGDFTQNTRINPAKSACGFLHNPPNSTYYGDGNRSVSEKSNCNQWYNYPNVSNEQEGISCYDWGCNEGGVFFEGWWLAHIPKYQGVTDGKLNNWWRYVLDFGVTNIPPTPQPPKCGSPCTYSSYCKNIDSKYYCRSGYSWADWKTMSGAQDLRGVGSGTMTSFSEVVYAGTFHQHVVRGGVFWFRTRGSGKKWSSWSNQLTAAAVRVYNAGFGTLTGYSLVYDKKGQRIEHVTKGGKVYYSTNSGSWKPRTSFPHTVSGTILTFSSSLHPDGYLEEYLVRGGRLYERNKRDGWSGWNDISQDFNDVVGDGGGISMFKNISYIQGSYRYSSQYLIKNNGKGAMRESRMIIVNGGECRHKDNPESNTCDPPSIDDSLIEYPVEGSIVVIPGFPRLDESDGIGKSTVTIKALGSKGKDGKWPRMQLLVKDKVVRTWTVDSTKYKDDYTHAVDGSLKPNDIKVRFTNDDGPRNLRVDYMKLGSKTYQTEASTTYSTGTWTRGDGCSDDYKESEWLKCNGYFHYMARSSRSSSSTNNVPDGSGYSNGGDDSSTTQIQIKARGRKDDGWPLMDLLVNDVLVKRWEVKSTGSKTYTHEVSGSPKASDIKVRFPNDKKKRDLRVEYIKLDGKKYKTRDTDTYSTGLYDKGCQKAYYDKDYGKEFEWLRCNGYFHFEAPSGQGGGSGSSSSGSPSASGNLILNGDFEAGGSNWNFVSSSSKNRVFTPSGSGIGGGQAAVVSIGEKTKELLLNQAGFQLKPRTKYKLTFYAKGNRKNARFRAYIHENVGKDWDDKDYSYGVRKTSAKLNTDWKKFTKTFTTPKESDSGDKSLPNPMLTFEFDNYEKVGDGYWIDNVILEER